MSSPTLARALLVVLGLLAAGEGLRGVQLRLQTSTAHDWRALASRLQDVEVPVLAHRSWIDPTLRRWIPAAARPSSFAAPDLADVPEFWTVGHRSDPAALDRPVDATLEQASPVGPWVLRRWTQPAAQQRLAGWGAQPSRAPRMQARVPQGRCRVQGDDPLRIRCPDQTTLRWELAEIDYRARECLVIRSSTLSPIELDLEFPRPSSGGTLVGHIGYSDFNARIRSDASLQVTIRHQGQTWIRRPVSDAQGWVRLTHDLPAFADEPGPLRLQVTLQLNAARTPTGQLERMILPCLELRVLEDRP